MKKFNLLKIDDLYQDTFKNIIYLTRDDLIYNLKDIAVNEIKLAFFKVQALNEKQKINAKLIVFKENFTYHILKRNDITLKRVDLLPEYHLVPIESMELQHFKYNDSIQYANNIVYDDFFYGYHERLVLKR